MRNIDKITESQNPKSVNIDSMDISKILNLINEEDTTVASSVKLILSKLENLIEDVIQTFQCNGRLFYVGSGTSGRLGVLDAVECPPTFSTDPKMIHGIIAGGYDALVRSIESAEDKSGDGIKAIRENTILKKDMVIGITASSNTPFVLGALQEAYNIGAVTGLIICNNPPELNYINHIIPVITGPEVITGSTRMKAGTATKMILNMITSTAMIKLNKTYGNLMVDLKASNNKLWARGARIIAQLTELKYDDALLLLKQANGEVKTAIVMNELNLNNNDAKKILKSNNGSLIKTLQNN